MNVDAPASVAETHVSWVFFVGDRAYKLKKPLLFDFVDMRNRAERRRLCEREVELNRRLAPDVYLGVSDVLDVDGSPCDHLVVMRRMPDDTRLSWLVSEGKPVEDDVMAVARQMAAFHHGLAPIVGEAAGALASAAELAHRWDDNVMSLARFSGQLQGGRAVPRIGQLAHAYLDGRAWLFEGRTADGRVRDGHGDLLADDIFCLPDGPRLLDCLEFDDSLRACDGLADMAFLAMDLERLDRPDLAALLLDTYRELADDSWPESLAHHYIAYRAVIRAKVAALRAEQTTGLQRWRVARHLVGLCLDHLEQAAVRLVLVGGLPGTGKSTVAAGLGAELGATVLRTDVVRKERFGLAASARAGAEYNEGLYSPEVTRATYLAVLERARLALELGRSVVVDGSWQSASERALARELAASTASELVQLRCTLPARMAVARIRGRAADGVDPSDATEAVAAEMAARFEPWPGAVTLSTAGLPRAVLDEAVRVVRGGHAPHHAPHQ